VVPPSCSVVVVCSVPGRPRAVPNTGRICVGWSVEPLPCSVAAVCSETRTVVVMCSMSVLVSVCAGWSEGVLSCSVAVVCSVRILVSVWGGTSAGPTLCSVVAVSGAGASVGASPALWVVARCGRRAGGVRCEPCLLSLWRRGCPAGVSRSSVWNTPSGIPSGTTGCGSAE